MNDNPTNITVEANPELRKSIFKIHAAMRGESRKRPTQPASPFHGKNKSQRAKLRTAFFRMS